MHGKPLHPCWPEASPVQEGSEAEMAQVEPGNESQRCSLQSLGYLGNTLPECVWVWVCEGWQRGTREKSWERFNNWPCTSPWPARPTSICRDWKLTASRCLSADSAKTTARPPSYEGTESSPSRLDGKWDWEFEAEHRHQQLHAPQADKYFKSRQIKKKKSQGGT